MIVLCERPRQLGAHEALAWLHKAMREVTDREAVARVQVTELENVSMGWARSWDWLIEVQVADSASARRLVAETPWGSLLADLRLLGMRPSVALADRTRETPLGPAG
jgi:hypothetical protein